MASITVQLSQSAYNAVIANDAQSPSEGSALADTLGLFFVLDQNFAATHPLATTSNVGGSSARLSYADGGYTAYSGVVFADPNASAGSVSASHVESDYPNNYHLSYDGLLNYHYTLNGANATLVYDGGTLQRMAVKTLLPPSNPGYDPTFGSTTLTASGDITVGLGSYFNGVLRELTIQSEHVVASSKIYGDFALSGNAFAIGMGLGQAKLSGTLHGLEEHFYDGSQISLTNLALAITADTIVDEGLLADPNNLPGDDTISISLPATLVQPWLLASGAGNDNLSISGGGAGLAVNGGSGNDRISFGDHGHAADGGSGTDTAIFAGARAAYTITKTVSGYTVQASGGGPVDTLSNIERLQFADTSLAYDISGNGGQAYRLYQAAFNRTPDASGLGFWMQALDNGATLTQVASQFMASREFNDLYGSNLSNAAFVDQLYQNVLHRAGDTAGADYWIKALGNGAARADLLASFGESGENQAALAVIIGNGFSFNHYG